MMPAILARSFLALSIVFGSATHMNAKPAPELKKSDPSYKQARPVIVPNSNRHTSREEKLLNALRPEALKSYAGIPVAIFDFKKIFPGNESFIQFSAEAKKEAGDILHAHIKDHYPAVDSYIENKITKENFGPKIYQHLVEKASLNRGSAYPVTTGKDNDGFCLIDSSYLGLEKLGLMNVFMLLLMAHNCNDKISAVPFIQGTSFKPGAFVAAFAQARERLDLTAREAEGYVIALQGNGMIGVHAAIAHYVELLDLPKNQTHDSVYAPLIRRFVNFVNQLGGLTPEARIEAMTHAINGKGIEAYFSAVKLKENALIEKRADAPIYLRPLTDFIAPEDADLVKMHNLAPPSNTP